MKIILAISIASMLAVVASAQLTYSSVRIPVESGTTCPANWTSQTESIVVEARFYIHVPASIGGRVFLVTPSLVAALWPSAASRAAAVTSGLLEVQAQSAVTKSFCALLP